MPGETLKSAKAGMLKSWRMQRPRSTCLAWCKSWGLGERGKGSQHQPEVLAFLGFLSDILEISGPGFFCFTALGWQCGGYGAPVQRPGPVLDDFLSRVVESKKKAAQRLEEQLMKLKFRPQTEKRINRLLWEPLNSIIWTQGSPWFSEAPRPSWRPPTGLGRWWGSKSIVSSHTQFLHCTLKSVLCLLLCTLQMHEDILGGLKWSILLHHFGMLLCLLRQVWSPPLVEL